MPGRRARPVFVSIGLAGNCAVVRTILYSLRAARCDRSAIPSPCLLWRCSRGSASTSESCGIRQGCARTGRLLLCRRVAPFARVLRRFGTVAEPRQRRVSGTRPRSVANRGRALVARCVATTGRDCGRRGRGNDRWSELDSDGFFHRGHRRVVVVPHRTFDRKPLTPSLAREAGAERPQP